ncbi:MAG: aldehyde dehydrogenase family protein [Betaproteobacteria bacterium]|nr:aldehyde dehydrogenase family protein [Betaproteobacteria bacterium]
MGKPEIVASPARDVVRAQVDRARAAQAVFECWTQERVDDAVAAAGWAIVKPENNRRLAELAVKDTGLGSVADKIAKNERKTMGLLRDLQGLRTVGMIAERPELGITEIARPVGVVAAVTPSTNPGATPANKIINALKCRNAVILAPSPKGFNTGALLLEFMHAELDKVGAPRDLVQILAQPVTKDATRELMRQADLIVATGSQANVRAAYSSGKPAFGVGLGNVSVIIDASADVDDAAAKICASKCFDNATSCSSENSLVIVAPVWDAMIAALKRAGGALLTVPEKAQLQNAMWPSGELSAAVMARPVAAIVAEAGLPGELAGARFLMVEEDAVGGAHPYSGEKLSLVLTLYRARDFDAAFAQVRSIYAYQGAGHSVGIHTRNDAQVMRLGLEMPAARVIVNQAHAIANGGAFDNGLPFSLSMGCGTWGGNSISENLHWKHYLNITRVVRTIPPRTPSIEGLFGAYHRKFGA